jgi:glycine/D-amino acid oxidase-like deaminating enzyme
MLNVLGEIHRGHSPSPKFAIKVIPAFEGRTEVLRQCLHLMPPRFQPSDNTGDPQLATEAFADVARILGVKGLIGEQISVRHTTPVIA